MIVPAIKRMIIESVKRNGLYFTALDLIIVEIFAITKGASIAQKKKKHAPIK